MGRKKKLDKLGRGAKIFVHQLSAEGTAKTEIAEKVEEVYNTPISRRAISTYLNSGKDDRLQKMGYKNMQELQKKEAEYMIDVNKKLEKLEKKFDVALNTLNPQDKQDIGLLKQVSQEMRELMKFQKKYIEQITEPNTEINISKTEQAIQINNRLDKLEDEGVIKILKPEEI